MRCAWRSVLVVLAAGCADNAPEDGAGGGASGDTPDALTSGPVGGGGASGGASGRGPDAGGSPPPGPGCAATDACDELDDDCDGRVDEGCACQGANVCYGGPPATRGVGACEDGARDCDEAGEFWRDCLYWIGPADETCENGVDEDCDGQVDEGCAPREEVCGNGVDEDLDGEVDEGCFGCEAAEACGDGIDEDCDGQIDEGCRPECLPDELCDDALDNDCDGAIDDGCEDECPPNVSRACFPGPPAQIGIGVCRAGAQRCVDGGRWGECEGAMAPGAEACDNGLDDNCDGRVDEGCRMCGADDVCGNGEDDDCDGQVDEACGECVPGAQEACGGVDGPAPCRAGQRTCGAAGEWGPCEGAVGPAAEVCGNGIDEDCAGGDAECGPVEVPIFLIGDCLTVRCPPEAPHPVGCRVFFSPGDDRGCVAANANSPVVYFQAGDQCNRGFVTGTLLCSDMPGPPLSPANCPINKPVPIYPGDRSGCPEVDD